MKKIKIVRIIARLNIGGPAIHAVLLTQGLDRERFETVLISGSKGEFEGDMSYYAREKNVQPLYIPELQRELGILKDAAAFARIFSILMRERPDIIHTHTAKAGALGRAAAILYNCFAIFCGRPAACIHTFHGSVFEGYFGRMRARLFVAVEKILACFTSVIVTVSESNKQELVSLGICPAKKIKVIPLGFELERFLGIPFTARESGTARIGIVGRLVPIKNHRLFLESAGLVAGRVLQDKAHFAIVGDGESRRELQDFARELGILSSVDFMGWQQDLALVYSRLDIVALTSRNEGTPVSLIEAMASSRAVVATAVGGVPDLLGREVRSEGVFSVCERGILVKRMDAESFAAALLFLLQREDLRKSMAQSGRDFTKRAFAKERLFSDIQALYEGLFAPGSRAA